MSTDTPALEADYVIAGAGASAMSFADVILTESDRTIIMVDQHATPGGHWNHAYPFVKLHQPSAFYGVSSRPLGRQVRDSAGHNAGLFEMATGQQVLSYFGDVLREQFLPTGRVTFLPMSEYHEDGTVLSLVSGARTRVRARRKVVDAHYFGSEVPSTHTPTFAIAPDAHVIPVNALASLTHAPGGFVVLGCGKTGADACVFLIEQGVDPRTITWARPRDLWFLNRAKVQPDATQLSSFADMLEISARATDLEDLVLQFEAAGLLLRVDRDRWPTQFRGATCSPAEIEMLRTVGHSVRLGHATGVERTAVHFADGDLPIGEDWLVVDCTALGLKREPPKPMFEADRITLEYTALFGSPAFSAAIVARAELASEDDELKNLACPALGVCELIDIARYIHVRLEVPEHWAALPGMTEWVNASRLNPASWALAAVAPDDTVAQGAIMRVLERTDGARQNLSRILGQVPTPNSD